MGVIEMTLTTNVNGDVYRFTGGVHITTVNGSFITAIEGDPEDTTWVQPLSPGNYEVRVVGDQLLSKVEGDVLTPVPATVVDGVQHVEVRENETSALVFHFNLGGALIPLTRGNLSVSISVVEGTQPGGYCNRGQTCAEGLRCIDLGRPYYERCVQPCTANSDCTLGGACRLGGCF